MTRGASATPAASSPSIMPQMMFMVLIVGVMWLFLIRPQQVREKERKAMLAALGKGDKVITQGGICGTIIGLNDKTVVLKVCDEPVTKVEFVRGAVSQVASTEDEPASS